MGRDKQLFSVRSYLVFDSASCNILIRGEKMKYIIFECGDVEMPVIFAGTVAHNVMERMVRSEYPGLKPISAGFYKADDYVNDGKPYVEGGSMTLNLQSRAEDLDIIDVCMRV